MTKYLVFKNEFGSGISNELNSTEAIACEITLAIGMDNFPGDRFISYLVDSAHAVMATLKDLPVASLVLDDERVVLWTNEASQIYDALISYQDAIDNACASLLGAANDLESATDDSEHFSDFVPEVDFDSAFDYLHTPDLTGFSEKLAEIFEFEVLNR